MKTDVAKWVGAVTMIGGMAFAAHERFIAAENSIAGHADVLRELRAEDASLSERLSAIERDRAMIERVHSIETQLAAIKTQLVSIDSLLRGHQK